MADGDDRKSALIAQLAAQRASLSRHAGAVRESLDVGKRIKSSFTAHRVVWLAGAVFAGLALARSRPGKSGRSRPASGSVPNALRAGFAMGVVKLIFNLMRPTLISMLTARIADFAANRSAPRRNPVR